MPEAATAALLREIADPALARAHLDRPTRDAIIVRLCAVTPLTIRELAALTDRGAEHMKSVVGALVKSGDLTYLHPDRPRARGQRYVATSSGEIGER
jgi:hypothetical protein